MIQIIPEKRKPTGIERFGEILSSGLRGAAEGAPVLAEALKGRKERRDLGNLVGQDLSNIRNPKFQEEILGSNLRQKESASKLRGEYEADQKNFETMKNAFGDKFANVWLAAGRGERTALTNAALEAKARGLDLDQLLSGEGIASAGQEQPQTKNNKTTLQGGEEFAFPEIAPPPNLTPKELAQYHGTLRKDNKSIHKENVDKTRAIKDTAQHLDILEDLNTKIPEGLARLAVDKEGNIRPTALRFKAVPKEMERFSKTVNDFLASAKDMFGSRVTNYDVAQFKSRLPGLLNSKEGRTEIIKQMQLLNQIEQNYRNALNQIYRHYGLDGIPEERAIMLAEQMTEPEEERLRSQLMQIGKEESQLSGRFVDVVGPDGQLYEVDEGEVDLLPEGFRLQ